MTVLRLPAAPADRAVDAWHDVVRAAHTHDLPATVPPPGRAESAGKLRHPGPRTRAVHLAAVAADGSYDGVATLVLFDEDANRHTAFLDVLAVHPRARNRGTGAALWQAARAQLADDGRTSVSTVVERGGRGETFARGLGFENVLPLGWYVQNVPDALAARQAEPVLPDGYAYAHWTGVVPDRLADAFAEAHDAMRDAPTGDMDQAPRAWDAARVRAAAQVVGDRGGVILSSAVLHRADGAETVAAYTELVLRDPSDTRALQYDTVVVPVHRGRGLGAAVKHHMMGVVAAACPGVREIGTTVAEDNGPMLAVNERLGYRRERTAGYFQATLEE
ncbi:GNAT family N-acetyltransferase [Streptomyces sp. PKU-EA00015]|uniref:GNAT family N-acetyltransferase n=1 Tax=Streptomyces sp. PKU-EA00015 TaxID=2748326 RepID=UPI0015A4CFA6|nr:GNAT family N-acetyltransferase [Streptomyces sp. PKU-EA00015]NWF29629.1 GNAT family N-acetyltransferase [Streptomyces sp. PKU-EA00015]